MRANAWVEQVQNNPMKTQITGSSNFKNKENAYAPPGALILLVCDPPSSSPPEVWLWENKPHARPLPDSRND